MPDEIKAILEDCSHGSAAGRLTFPQVIRNLLHAGVERYHADLQRAETTYYLPDGDSLCVRAHVVAQKPAEAFDPAGIEAALRAIQAKQISYLGFCEQIMKAGCVSYIVSLAGRRAVYYGRTGEVYVEPFPQAA